MCPVQRDHHAVALNTCSFGAENNDSVSFGKERSRRKGFKIDRCCEAREESLHSVVASEATSPGNAARSRIVPFHFWGNVFKQARNVSTTKSGIGSLHDSEIRLLSHGFVTSVALAPNTPSATSTIRV